MSMTKEQMDKYVAFDDAAAECGGYVDPNPPKYKWSVRTLLDYCEEHSIDPEKLTDEDVRNIEKIDEAKRNKQVAA